MKILKLFAVACACLLPALSFAQKEQGEVVFQDTEVHKSFPELRVFVTPQICDLQMVNSKEPRQEFETFYNLAKGIDSLTEAEFENLKRRAMYEFASEQNADVIIEPIFNTKVFEKNTKRIYIAITGYPAKYVNFRPLGKEDINTVQVVYPASFQNVLK